MLELEGSRHERVYLVLASYIIGFTTAFIGFGVNQLNGQKTDMGGVQSASVIQTQMQTHAKNDVALKETSQGLILAQNGNETLLTARRDAVSNAEVGKDGIYASLAAAELSPDKNYAYFCEVPVPNATDCKPFVYSLDHKLVIPLKSNGQRIAFPANDQRITWSIHGIATIDGTAIDSQLF